MKNKQYIYFIFAILIFIPLVSSIEFTLSGVEVNPSGIYQGDSPTLTAKIVASSNNICDMKCDWSINIGPDYNGDISTIIGPNKDETFPFRVNAEGQSTNYVLSVNCVREPNYVNCWPGGEVAQQYSDTLNFNYAGDGECTTSKEKCEDYGAFTGTNDCACDNPPKECFPDSIRGTDSYGCATYCGNGVTESGYETCSNCQDDVGKCDGLSCISGNECEGNYCVHETCWDKPYKTNDGYCDVNNGEDNKNSPIDCACEDNERWSSLAKGCETYCGNNQCELNEDYATCPNDCEGCGDNICQKNEDCLLCLKDCGVCENKEAVEKIQQETKEAIDRGLESSSNKQKIINYSALLLIIVFILGYLFFKFMMSKKDQKKLIKSVDDKLDKLQSKPKNKRKTKKKAKSKK